MPVKMLGHEGGGFGRGLTLIGGKNECQRGRWALRGVNCEIPHRLGRNTLYKGVETFLKQTRFKNLEGKPERESPKRTIFTSGRLGPLQNFSETSQLLSFL